MIRTMANGHPANANNLTVYSYSVNNDQAQLGVNVGLSDRNLPAGTVNGGIIILYVNLLHI